MGGQQSGGAGWGAGLKVLAVSAIIFLAVLKLADVAIGSLAPPQREIPYRSIVLREHPPNLSLEITRDAAYAATKDGLVPRSVTLRTDEDGFIIGPRHNDGPVGIAFVGGSTIECADVAEDRRYPYLVSQRLAWTENGAPVRVLNSGVSASHSLHGSFLILAKVLKYRPRAVVMMEDINDLALLANTGSYWRAPPARQIVAENTDLLQPRPLRALFVAAKNVTFPNLWQLVHPPGSGGLGDEFASWRDTAPSREAIIADYRAVVEMNVAMLRAWHIEPVLMTQFNRMESDDQFVKKLYESNRGLHGANFDWDAYVSLYKALNDVVREVAAEQNVLLIDLDKDVPKTRAYIMDPVHLNDEGSELVAGLIASALAERIKEFQVAGPR